MKNFLHKNLRPSTVRSYEKVLTLFLKMNPHISTPDKLTVEDVIKWRNEVLKTAKPITWNTYLRHMRSFYNFAIDNEFISLNKNPFLKLSLREGKEKRKVLSDEQLQALDKLLSNDYLLPDIFHPRWFTVALIKTFRYTGIRRSQLIQLRICDIDLSKRIITIPSNINKNHNYHEIPISDKLYPDLEKLVLEMTRIGRKKQDQLFNLNVISRYTRFKGCDMTKDQVSYLFYVLSKLLGFKVSTHRFRHTIATQLMKNVDNLYNVKQLLGHSDLKVTLSYVEYNSEMIRNCVNSL
ncbi:site-specific integrase [Pasteurella skyensis]|uniref:tyrosine-type recombinase/integrase n=1 Tax=Phocoenobacter skyensis TaxID=97481 RepID=UPI0027470485|nr:site-specific integrase [Pasteurella skyensis]MDP8189046.1 site-specific integrase [Pasteurella skyensis]